MLFNLTYAKRNGVPKYTEFETKKEVIEFLLENLDNMDLLTINNMIIDINLLIKKIKEIENEI
jgi:hypothetical protein